MWRAGHFNGELDSMGHLDTAVIDDECYETRELTWELQQKHADPQRIKFLIEQGADVARALSFARIQEKDIMKRPELRQLQLQRHLHLTENIQRLR